MRKDGSFLKAKALVPVESVLTNRGNRDRQTDRQKFLLQTPLNRALNVGLQIDSLFYRKSLPASCHEIKRLSCGLVAALLAIRSAMLFKRIRERHHGHQRGTTPMVHLIFYH